MAWVLIVTVAISAVALAAIYLHEALPAMGVRSGKPSRACYLKYGKHAVNMFPERTGNHASLTQDRSCDNRVLRSIRDVR
jgi:hypothetical protein